MKWLLERHTASPHQNKKIMTQFYDLFLSIRFLKCPTIAAINGAAIGAGAAFPLACGELNLS